MAEEKQDDLRDVNERAADEARAWSGDEQASKRREVDERYNDARGDRSDLAWGGGGMQREDRGDSVTIVVNEDKPSGRDTVERDERRARDRDEQYQKHQREPDREAP